jgi:flagellar operon protein
MDAYNKLTLPVTTGAPAAAPQPRVKGQVQTGTGTQFLALLQQKLEAGSHTAFSKHAVSRVHERQIDVSQQSLERLNQGMQLAQEKGLAEALILIDENAYIVNAAQSKVVTVNGGALKGSVFTNIDGTVIV